MINATDVCSISTTTFDTCYFPIFPLQKIGSSIPRKQLRSIHQNYMLVFIDVEPSPQTYMKPKQNAR
jgi:hypothetical protein